METTRNTLYARVKALREKTRFDSINSYILNTAVVKRSILCKTIIYQYPGEWYD